MLLAYWHLVSGGPRALLNLLQDLGQPCPKELSVQTSRVPTLRNAVSEQGSKVIMILFKVIKIRFKPLVLKHATKTHLKKLLVSHQENMFLQITLGQEFPLYSPEIRNEQAEVPLWRKKWK